MRLFYRAAKHCIDNCGIVYAVIDLYGVMIHLSPTVRANQFGFRHALGLLVL